MERKAFGALEIVAYSFPDQVGLRYRLTSPAGVSLHREGAIGPEPWERLRGRLAVSAAELEPHEAMLVAGSQRETLGIRQFWLEEH